MGSEAIEIKEFYMKMQDKSVKVSVLKDSVVGGLSVKINGEWIFSLNTFGELILYITRPNDYLIVDEKGKINVRDWSSCKVGDGWVHDIYE